MRSVKSEVRIREINPEQMKYLEKKVDKLDKKRNFWIIDYNQTGEGFPFEILFEFEYDNEENPWQISNIIKALFLEIAELIMDESGAGELDLVDYTSILRGVS